MATYTQIYYHIVFSTKNRARCLIEAQRDHLFRYIWGIIKNKQSHLYRVGGVEDHVHIFTSLHPTVCLADFVKDVKTSTSSWIKCEGLFPGFEHWQDGYGAFTHSSADENRLIEYIKNQQEHHRRESFLDEYRRFLQEAEIQFDEKYLA